MVLKQRIQIIKSTIIETRLELFLKTINMKVWVKVLCVSLPLFPQDDEINQQSQLMEELNEQMLDQEEVTLHPLPSFLSHPLPSHLSHCASALQTFLLPWAQS